MSAPAGPTTTLSTSALTIRACSAGNNSSQSGSSRCSASRTSLSVRSGISRRPASHVPTTTSGCRSRARTWLAARKEAPDLTEREVRDALHRLDPVWDELFPAEQARIVRALVERVVVGPVGADIRLRVEGLAGLVRDLSAIAPEALSAAA